MNYRALHDRIIARARSRKLPGYSEKHHVVPQCLGGTNEASNLVRLTAREHFLVHRILVRLCPEVDALVFAAWMMHAKGSNQQRVSREYGRLKEKHAQAMSRLHKGKKLPAEMCAAISARFKGKPTWNKGKKTGISWNRGTKGISGRPKGIPSTFKGKPRWSQEQKDHLRRKALERLGPTPNHAGYKVLTPTGFQPFDGVSFNGIRETLKITLSDRSSIECSRSHRFVTPKGEVKAEDCREGDFLTSALSVVQVESVGKKHVFDLVNVGGGHAYCTNNVVSHNCVFKVAESEAVVPEWGKLKVNLNLVRNDIDRPEFYYPLVTIDLGLVDYTAVLFGYWHFAKATSVIEDELLLKGINSEKLVKACREKELELWGEDPPKSIVRVADGQSFTLNDITTIHKYPVGLVSKDNVEAQANKIRLDVQSGKLVINPRCVHLLGQIEDATWNLSRTSFSRDAENGHFDLVAALQYFVRHVNRHTNPFPPHYQIDVRNTVMKQGPLNNPSLAALKKAFTPKQEERPKFGADNMASVFTSQPGDKKRRW